MWYLLSLQSSTDYLHVLVLSVFAVNETVYSLLQFRIEQGDALNKLSLLTAAGHCHGCVKCELQVGKMQRFLIIEQVVHVVTNVL
jgi:hypothetical protein